MGVDLDNSQKLVLRREVLYPQKQNTGVGVMLVASAAMFFAVASSAFILRAQMPMQECPGDAQRYEAVSVELIDSAEIPPRINVSNALETCGDPIYQANPDGSVSVFFDLCSSDDTIRASR